MRASIKRRSGVLLLDAAIATAVLVIAMSLTLQVVDRVAAQRRAADRRQLAVQCASNVMERLAARSWDGLAVGQVVDMVVDDDLTAAIPEAICQARIDDVKATNGKPRDMRKITVDLRWRDRAGANQSNVRLVTWVARAGRRAP